MDNKHSGHFELSRLKRDSSYTMHAPHTHSYYELFYLFSGECDVHINQTIYTITPGMAIFIPPNVPHKTTYKGSRGNERLNIAFSADYISNLTDELGQMWLDRYLFNGPFKLSHRARPAISAAITRLEVACAAQADSTYTHTQPTVDIFTDNPNIFGDVYDIFTNCMRKLHFQELVIALLRCNTRSDYVTSDEMQISDISVIDAKKYIELNYNEPLTLDSLAHRYQLNPAYFSSKFKSVNGIGFKEYLNNVRIIQAERLLIETNMSVTEIALECGYETSNYFGDAFRKINHVSPSQFRKAKGHV